MRRFSNTLGSLLTLISLSVGLDSCQTTRSSDEGHGGQNESDDGAKVDKKLLLLEAQRALVRNALDEGKPQDALQMLRQLLRQYPDDGPLLNLMGLTQLALKNPKSAVTMFQRAYKVEPLVGTALNLSSAYLETGDYGKAVKLLRAMKKVADRDNYQFKERIAHNLGYAHLKLKHTTDAVYWFKAALEENPTYYPSSLELARIYEATQKSALAAETYKRAVDYCRSCLEPVQALTKIYLKSGKVFEAKKLLIDYGKNDNISVKDRAAARQLGQLVDSSQGAQLKR